MTNDKIILDIMNHSKFGALSQMFVVDALTKHAERVADSKPEDYPAGSFVHPHAWIGVAQEIKAKLEKAYK